MIYLLNICPFKSKTKFICLTQSKHTIKFLRSGGEFLYVRFELMDLFGQGLIYFMEFLEIQSYLDVT